MNYRIKTNLTIEKLFKSNKKFFLNVKNDEVCVAARRNEIVTYEKDKTEEKYISEWPQTIF